MAGWDERQQLLLRRKLQALNYSDHLDPGSCDLVQNLVNDLIHTTESYRGLKQQSDRQQQEIASFRSKVSTPLRPMTVRIVRKKTLQLWRRAAD